MRLWGVLSLMKLKTASFAIVLLSMMVELMDPSTNFIRSGVDSKIASIGAMGISAMVTNQLESRTHPGSADSEQGARYFQETSLCYATVATDFVFKVMVLSDLHSDAFYQEHFNKYYPSIFQPPKHS